MPEDTSQPAQQALADQAHFTLSPERWKEFREALDAPAREIPALKKLFREKGVFDKE